MGPGGVEARPAAPALLGQADTLELLARVGQDITASLAFPDIFAAIERHVGQLLDTATLYIGLLDPSGEWLDIPLFVDGGRRVPGRRMRVDDPDRPACRAVRERREILKEKTLAEAIRNDIPGTEPTLTALFRPLFVRDRMIGVISVQSARPHAYGDRERLIVRLLASHAAVALANAESYRRLAVAEAEKVATLGQLVAGVAHEVNTPVGSALTVATELGRLAADFARTAEAGTLRRSDLAAFTARTAAAADQLTANLTRASELVGRFKQVVTEHRPDDRRLFRLAELVGAVLTSLAPELAERADRVEVAVPGDLELDTSPAALGEVLTDLLANALQHGLPDGRTGTVRVDARASSHGLVQIGVTDDGAGVPAADEMRLFDPFFTTRRGQGHVGLGLYIARNLATARLGGRLTYLARPGLGASFCLEIPARPFE